MESFNFIYRKTNVTVENIVSIPEEDKNGKKFYKAKFGPPCKKKVFLK